MFGKQPSYHRRAIGDIGECAASIAIRGLTGGDDNGLTKRNMPSALAGHDAAGEDGDGRTLNGVAMSIKWKSWVPIAVGLALLVSPVPSGLKADAWHYFAVFAAVITGLVLESMPVGAVGLSLIHI